MNKSEIVRLAAKDSGMTIKDVDKAVSAFLLIVGDLVASGEEVKLSGLGKFYFKTLGKHKMYSFKDEKVVELEPRERLRFKLSEKISERMKSDGLR